MSIKYALEGREMEYTSYAQGIRATLHELGFDNLLSELGVDEKWISNMYSRIMNMFYYNDPVIAPEDVAQDIMFTLYTLKDQLLEKKEKEHYDSKHMAMYILAIISTRIKSNIGNITKIDKQTSQYVDTTENYTNLHNCVVKYVGKKEMTFNNIKFRLLSLFSDIVPYYDKWQKKSNKLLHLSAPMFTITTIFYAFVKPYFMKKDLRLVALFKKRIGKAGVLIVDSTDITQYQKDELSQNDVSNDIQEDNI